MKGKGVAVIFIIILLLVLLGWKIVEVFQSFLNSLTSFLATTLSGAGAPEIGLMGGLGVALFAFLLIILLIFAVAIIQFLLSQP
jgi:hypothetical protein